MNKLTKGPWRAKQLFATYTEHSWVIQWPDKGGSHMRRLDDQGKFTRADAALISAAPELLDTCERLIAWSHQNHSSGESLSFMQQARDAVAKAKDIMHN